MDWYALYTKPRAEKRVRQKLQMQGVECYLPLHRTPRVWSDRVKMVDMPLFSSYIFVQCKELELWQLLKISNVVRIVFYDGKPAMIRQTEIDAIKAFLQLAEGKPLSVGDEAEILAGPMKSRSGKILEIRKKYAILRIEALAATVKVEFGSIAAIDRLR